MKEELKLMTVAGESDAAYCGGLRRNAECDRAAESWY